MMDRHLLMKQTEGCAIDLVLGDLLGPNIGSGT